jgi:hypothetical protein
VTVDMHKMRRRSHSLRRAFSMKLRGSEKHAATHLQAWWRAQLARLAEQRVQKAARIQRQKILSAAALAIQRTIARGCAGRRRFYEAREFLCGFLQLALFKLLLLCVSLLTDHLFSLFLLPTPPPHPPTTQEHTRRPYTHAPAPTPTKQRVGRQPSLN